MYMENSSMMNEYTQDGSVDLRGNAVLKSKRGGWKAFFFLAVFGIFDRMAYFGVSSNLINYLTKKLHRGTIASSNFVTNWSGTMNTTPIIGAYVADAHLGRYWTSVIGSCFNLLGMCLLTLSVSLPSLKPPVCNEMDAAKCKKASTLQLGVFYGALYILALGTGGTRPNISTFGADQFDDFDPKEKQHRLSFFNYWMFFLVTGSLFSLTVLVYIQDNVGWTLGYALPTVGVAISILIFLAGTPFYRHKFLSESPLTNMAKVFVATIRKWNVVIPEDSGELYEISMEEYNRRRKVMIHPTPTLRFLNKACVGGWSSSSSEWSLCPVTQVEETKQMLRLIPIFVATFIPSAMVSQVNTLFLKQGTTLDRSIGKFTIPTASLAALATLTMLIYYILYEFFFVKIMQKWTNNPRGITPLKRMGTGLVIHMMIMLIACFIENHRLNLAKKHGMDVDNNNGSGHVPLTILVLAPQFILMGLADAILEAAKLQYFYDEAPDNMKSLGTSFSLTTTAIGNFINTFLLSIVSKITMKHAHKGWISDNLNASHLDYYYGFLAALNFFNFFFFLIVAKLYTYRAQVSDSHRN